MPPNNNNFFGGYGIQTQQPMQRNNDVLAVPVNGEIGAQNYPVAAGNTVLLTDFNSGFVWLKSNDPNGMFVNMRTFKVEEITPKPTPPTGDFVSRNEFEQLQSAINQLISRIGGNNNNESITNANAKSAAAIPAGK